MTTTAMNDIWKRLDYRRTEIERDGWTISIRYRYIGYDDDGKIGWDIEIIEIEIPNPEGFDLPQSALELMGAALVNWCHTTEGHEWVKNHVAGKD